MLNLSTIIYTANQAAAAGEEITIWTYVYTFAPFIIILAVMYFFMIRPQKKKQKEEEKMRADLQLGDEVTTIGGITGIIVRKGEDTVVIETGGDRSKIRIKTAAIQSNATIHDAKEE